MHRNKGKSQVPYIYTLKSLPKLFNKKKAEYANWMKINNEDKINRNKINWMLHCLNHCN